jgi:hypothetical protein
MQPLERSASIAQSAAFALFEALRQAQGLAAAPDGTCRATFLRALDPTVAGLAWTNAGDDALQLRWSEAPEGLGESLWVAAASEALGPSLSLFLHRDRPVLQARFAGASFVEARDGRYLLRERVTYSSHDGRHHEREDLTRRLAKAWRVPMDGPWLHVGTWDALEKAWEPEQMGPTQSEAARRLLAIALILEAARQLDPAWLEA